jgi:hypothetical protein
MEECEQAMIDACGRNVEHGSTIPVTPVLEDAVKCLRGQHDIAAHVPVTVSLTGGSGVSWRSLCINVATWGSPRSSGRKLYMRRRLSNTSPSGPPPPSARPASSQKSTVSPCPCLFVRVVDWWAWQSTAPLSVSSLMNTSSAGVKSAMGVTR